MSWDGAVPARGFHDRFEAGRYLGRRLRKYAKHPDVLVLGLPRGGIPVAYEVARELDVPMEPFLVRKLGAPGNPELAMGAIASGGIRVLNEELVRSAGITAEEIEEETRRQSAELERRDRLYRGDMPPLQPEGRTVILVDDGLATGATTRAAIQALRGRAARIVAAAPVASRAAFEAVRREADEAVMLMVPEDFAAVGQWYEDFRQVGDEEVRRLLGSDVAA